MALAMLTLQPSNQELPDNGLRNEEEFGFVYNNYINTPYNLLYLCCVACLPVSGIMVQHCRAPHWHC